MSLQYRVRMKFRGNFKLYNQYKISLLFWIAWITTTIVGAITAEEGLFAGQAGITLFEGSAFEPLFLGSAGILIMLIFTPELLLRGFPNVKLFDQLRQLTPADLGNILLYGIIGFALLAPVQLLVIKLYGVTATTGFLSVLSFGTGTGSLGTTAFSLFQVATVAVNEELLFRGGIMVAVQKYTKSPIIAIVMSSLLFGGLHLAYSGNPGVVLGVAADGAVLGVFFYISKRLEVPAMMHFLADLVSLR